MDIRETWMEGVFTITPKIFSDERGYFFEAFHARKFQDRVGNVSFCQDNQSFSKKGVLRGMHLQRAPHEQGKLVRTIEGKALDVVIDIRPESKTFGMHLKYILDSESGNMLYIPGGFAHGFLALTDVHFFYKCTDFYNKPAEDGIIWNDKDLDIDWELEKYGIEHPSLSEKDVDLKSFDQFKRELEAS